MRKTLLLVHFFIFLHGPLCFSESYQTQTEVPEKSVEKIDEQKKQKKKSRSFSPFRRFFGRKNGRGKREARKRRVFTLRPTFRRMARGYQRVPGIRLAYQKRLFKNFKTSMRWTYEYPKLMSPDKSLKLHHSSFQADNRYYFSDWVYSGFNFGTHHYRPNTAFRDLYDLNNVEIEEGFRHFVGVKLGMRPTWRLPIFKRRPVLTFSYTHFDMYRFPAAIPGEEKENRNKKFRFSLGFSF
ncbi:hypothetical protein ACFL35_02520 [Candidatus Riflebacteria bacterium]